MVKLTPPGVQGQTESGPLDLDLRCPLVSNALTPGHKYLKQPPLNEGEQRAHIA